MKDETMSTRDPGNEELRRRLEAYAEVRLSPDAASVVRMRSLVMAQAHRRSIELAAVPLTPASVGSPGANGLARRVVGGLVAASLTLGLVVGTVAASQAGGPFYPVRVWAESVTLPSDATERAKAELVRLQSRLDEATAAATVGDQGAMDAALEAYRSILARAETETGGDDALDDRLQTALGRHIVVLEGLLTRVHAEARDSISAAISRSNGAIDRVGGGTGPASGGQPPVVTGTPRPDGTPAEATPTPRATVAPVTPKPVKTPAPKPTAVPKPEPTPTATPDVTPKPHRTPPGQPVPSEHGGSPSDPGG
jgi:hypothetical protein